MSERLNFKSVEELLGVVHEEAAIDIEIYKIYGFKGHPFKVVDDEKMQELVQGIFEPILEIVVSQSETILIAGERYPAALVKSKFLKLNYMQTIHRNHE